MTDASRYRFPGMDPWLEHPAIWPDVHHRLITYLTDDLAERIAPGYTARHGERLIIECSRREVTPDVVVSIRRPRAPGPTSAPGATALEEPLVVVLPAAHYREPFIEIRDRRTGNRVVTVVEILSPSNKRKGTVSRRKYLEKQEELLASNVNLVEIDLLRGGEPTVAIPYELLPDFESYPYRFVVRRADQPDRCDVYRVVLRKRLLRLHVPLSPPDPDVVVDLQPLVERAYRAGGYGLDLDYEKAPQPQLDAPDLEWVRGILAGDATRG